MKYLALCMKMTNVVFKFLTQKLLLYFLRFTIFSTFDFLHNLMNYFDHLYIELYVSKNYKNLIL